MPGEVRLPLLRPDLVIRPGPDEPDGAPTWVVHDPVSDTYDRADAMQFEVIRHLRRVWTLEGLCQRLRRVTALPISPEYVLHLCQDLLRRGLTCNRPVAPVEELEAQRERMRPHWTRRLLGGIAYVRVPLVRPDTFLRATVPWVRWLGSRPAFVLYGLVALWGAVVLAQQWSVYVATLPRFLSMQGALVYLGALAGVKCAHEFGHAYVAAAYGCRVRTMGIALIFLAPVPYSDVTDAWLLRRRRQRLLISLGGVLTELVIAGCALLGWAVLPEGMGRSICFVLSSLTLVSTLLINLNPAMRYDGYYVLSDVLGVDNLQPRAFAMARWWWRRVLLGLTVDPPEARVGRWQCLTWVGYACFAWVYRFFLYMGISALLYHFIDKTVGILLASIQVYYFFGEPAVREVRAVARLRGALRWNPRLLLTLLVLVAVLLWIALPLPRWRSVSAVTQPVEDQVVYAPHAGEILAIREGLGVTARVKAGEMLVRLRTPDLEREAESLTLELEDLARRMRRASNDDQQKEVLPALIEERARIQAKQESLVQELSRNVLLAQRSGQIVQWREGMRVGQSLAARETVARVAAIDAWVVVAYVPAWLAEEVRAGGEVKVALAPGASAVPAAVLRIGDVPVGLMEEPQLASRAGGDVDVRVDERGRLMPADSVYRVELTVAGDAPEVLGRRGRLWIRTVPRSLLVDGVRLLERALLRESSF